MQLFAVLHSIGGFAREDSATPSIAGVYSDENIAVIVARASNGFVKEITLDYIAPGYINFAQEVLNIDLANQLKEKQFGLEDMNDLDKECHIDAQEFLEDAASGFFTGDDGHGYWATNDKVSSVSCWQDRPEWATHVCWFNK